MDTGSSVERMAGRGPKAQGRSFCPQNGGHVPWSPSGRTLRRDQSWRRWNRSQGTTWSPERSQDRCGAVDPVQAPSWRTPSPCMLLVVESEARTCRSPGWEPPKRDLGTMASNSFQVKENDRKTIIRMKSELKLSHFTEVPKATQEENERKLTISSSGRRGPPMKIAGFHPLLPASPPRHLCRRIAVCSTSRKDTWEWNVGKRTKIKVQILFSREIMNAMINFSIKLDRAATWI